MKKRWFVFNFFMKKKMICPELFYEKKMICPELSYWKKPNEVFLLNKIGNRVVW